MQVFRIVSLVCSLAWCVPAASAQDAKPWQAGVAKVSITPEKLMWMSGYGARDKPAQGKLTDLWAKALVLEDPTGRRGVLVTLDLVGIDRDLAREVCDDLKKKHDLPRESIILSVSHTHCGPVVRSNLITMYDLDAAQQKLVSEYAVSLRKKLVQAVDEAMGKIVAVKLGWGIGHCGFAVNRRTNKEADVPKLRESGQLKGPVDHDVPVLAVRDEKGRLISVVFGYACHATVLSFYEWCGDYPGFAQMNLEKTYPGAVALFWAGCGADQNPLPRRTVNLAEQYGRRLADSVQNIVDAPMSPITGELTPAYREVQLPFAELPTREKIAEDTLSKNKFIAGRARVLLQQYDKKGSLSGTYPYPVQMWRLGKELRWITLGGEVVVDYALRLKKELGPGSTWVMGYANDVMAYIPSLRVLKEGGYEGGGAMVYYGLPTVWAPRIEEIIVAEVKRLGEKPRVERLDVNQFIRLAAITITDKTREAWLRDLLVRDGKIRLAEKNGSDTFTIHTPDDPRQVLWRGKVLRIDQRSVFFEKDNRVYELAMGETLKQAFAKPLSDEAVKKLNLRGSPEKQKRVPPPSGKIAVQLHQLPWAWALQWLADRSGKPVLHPDGVPAGSFTYLPARDEPQTLDRIVDVLQKELKVLGYDFVLGAEEWLLRRLDAKVSRKGGTARA